MYKYENSQRFSAFGKMITSTKESYQGYSFGGQAWKFNPKNTNNLVKPLAKIVPPKDVSLPIDKQKAQKNAPMWGFGKP